MPAARKTAVPQDHKPKAEDARFEFVEGGKTYTGRPTLKTLTPGFLRANRKLEDLDALFTILEALFDEKALAAIDTMTRKRFDELQNELNAHLEISQGE